MNELTISEQERLKSLESIIESGLKTFVDVGMALLEVRDSKLYKATHDTFDGYCRERWGMSTRHANRLISAAKVSENLRPMGLIPTAERTVRPLAPLPPQQQREAWAEATQKADSESRPVTTRDVTDAVCKLKPHVSYNSGENEWYTPPEYIEAARRVMGGIDLDPASSDIANKIVKAHTYYTKVANGLVQEWHGRTWLNPPYSPELIKLFVSKYYESVENGTVTEGIVLVNNATETQWFYQLVECSSAVVFTKGRVRFLDPEGNPGAPLQGQAILYYGDNTSKFLGEFIVFGWGARL